MTLALTFVLGLAACGGGSAGATDAGGGAVLCLFTSGPVTTDASLDAGEVDGGLICAAGYTCKSVGDAGYWGCCTILPDGVMECLSGF